MLEEEGVNSKTSKACFKNSYTFVRILKQNLSLTFNGKTFVTLTDYEGWLAFKHEIYIFIILFSD